MREMRFRGKNKDGQWIYGEARTHKNDVCIFKPHANSGETVDEQTVGEFTGLRNKSSEDLYEGDIIEMDLIDSIFGDLVKITDGNYIKAPIIFKDGAFVVRYSKNKTICLDAIVRLCHCKVAGNIYDNADIITYPAEN